MLIGWEHPSSAGGVDSLVAYARSTTTPHPNLLNKEKLSKNFTSSIPSPIKSLNHLMSFDDDPASRGERHTAVDEMIATASTAVINTNRWSFQKS